MDLSNILSFYSPLAPVQLVYMLQQTEYDPIKFSGWLNRLPNLSKVMHRHKLVWTATATALVLFTYFLYLAPILWMLWATVGLEILSARAGLIFLIVIFAPLFGVVGLTLAVLFGRALIFWPREQKLRRSAEKIFTHHKGNKIAIAGSYGKTTLKEMLAVILSEGKKVAATPGNMNVGISHSRWAAKLTGKEDILIIEYGEGAPGDVAAYAHNTKPDIGIITGLAPNHLDKYKILEAVAKDLFDLAEYLRGQNVYVADNKNLKPYLKPGYEIFGSKAVLGWKISDEKVGLDGTRFKMKKGKKELNIHSGLLGRHQIAPLALCAALADRLGLTKSQIEAGARKTIPFEHRMQPMMIGGAWVIDDAYNGNISGIQAGLELLKELPAKRKIYITPGLVDQGEATVEVHILMGQLIAKSRPDRVVLIENSVTDFIEKGIKEAGFKGELVREPDPLGFYSNLDQFVAAGDLVMMQNDWPDAYN